MYVSTYVRQNILPAQSLEALLNALGTPTSAGVTRYVDSTVGTDASGYGQSWTRPTATIDYAIGLSAAGDTILVAALHNEGAGNAQIFDADVAGISIIGLGSGNQRPTLDFDHAGAICSVGAANVALYGLRFRPSVTDVAIGLEVETGIVGTTIENCEWTVGEDGAGVDEFIKAIRLVSGNHDTKFKDLVIRAHVSAAGATIGIHVDAASDRCVYSNVSISGPYATNGILEDAASADTFVEDCNVTVTGTNYGFVSTSTFARFFNNRGSESRVVNKLGQEFYPGYGYKVTKVEDGATVTSDDLFTLTGKVEIGLWTGEVTNALGATAKFSDYQITLTTLAGKLIAAGDISSSIIGHMFTLNQAAGDTALSTSNSAVSVGGVGDTKGKFGRMVVGRAGASDVIKAVRTAGDAGDAIRHDVFYMPLETGASLVMAA